MRPAVGGLIATDIVRLVLAVGAVAVETTMVLRGSRPDAELEGLLVPLGLLAGVVTLPYLVVTVLALTALSRPGEGGVRPTTALAVVDVALGLVAVATLGRAVVVGDPMSRSPLLWGLVPLTLGVVTLVLARPARRTVTAPTA